MARKCAFDIEVGPEIVEYALPEFQDYFVEKCVPALYTAVQKAKAQSIVIDDGAMRDVDVDVDLSCKIDDDFMPDCDGTITIKL